MRLLVGVTVLALAAACSGAPEGAAPQRPAAGAPPSELRIGLADFDIATSSDTVEAGAVTIDVTNVGATEHDLRIQGDTLDASVPALSPGGTSTVTIRTEDEREVTLWCTLPGHRSQGMEATLAVGG